MSGAELSSAEMAAPNRRRRNVPDPTFIINIDFPKEQSDLENYNEETWNCPRGRVFRKP